VQSNAKAYEPASEYSGVRHSMAVSPQADLALEVQRLRTEIQQLREIVNALFNAVFEDNEEEWESAPDRDDRFHLYN